MKFVLMIIILAALTILFEPLYNIKTYEKLGIVKKDKLTEEDFKKYSSNDKGN